MQIIYDNLNCRLLECIAHQEGIIEISDSNPFAWAYDEFTWEARLPSFRERVQTVLTDISFSTSLLIPEESHLSLLRIEGTSIFSEVSSRDPGAYSEAVRITKNILRKQHRYFQAAASLGYRYFSTSILSEEEREQSRLSLNQESYTSMISIIDEIAVTNPGLFFSRFEPAQIAVFNERLFDEIEELYSSEYAFQQSNYFCAIWTTFANLVQAELQPDTNRRFIRTGLSSQAGDQHNTKRDDVIAALRTSFAGLVPSVPAPRNIHEAIEFRDRREVRRLAELICEWFDAVEFGEEKLLQVLGRDIAKASKEIELIQRIRKINETDLSIVVRAVLSQIPLISNVLGVGDAALSFYLKRSSARLSWLRQDL